MTKKRKGISDKERLDWLEQKKATLEYSVGEWGVFLEGHISADFYPSLRQAIDAAIRKERK